MTTPWKPDEEDLAFWRLYGPWQPLDVGGLTELLAGFEEPWWVVGGQAIEAFSGVHRAHEDLDISFFPHAFDAFRDQVKDRYHVWCNDGGTLRVASDASPEPLDPLAQVWLREHALAPWVLDAIPTPQADGRWQSRRHEWLTADLDDVTWVDPAGVRFLVPEVVLLFKARQQRPKDELDLRSALPRMSLEQRATLRDNIARAHPGHDWLDASDAPDQGVRPPPPPVPNTRSVKFGGRHAPKTSHNRRSERWPAPHPGARVLLLDRSGHDRERPDPGEDVGRGGAAQGRRLLAMVADPDRCPALLPAEALGALTAYRRSGEERASRR